MNTTKTQAQRSLVAYEIKMARRRIAIKRQLRRAGITIPEKANLDINALRKLRALYL